VILNLAINARDAMDVGGSLTLRTANVTLGEANGPEDPGPGEYVMIAVTDTGSGMSPDVLARVFEPFFTTKEVGKGSGLGLSQVYGLAKQSGGGVRIESMPGRGTSVQVFLPRSLETAPQRESAAASSASTRHAHRRVLVVDDDRAVREVTAGLLTDLGYGVIEAGSGGAALEVLDQDQAVDLLLLDFAMPGMNGAELAREARMRRPDLPILFVTGYADTEALPPIDREGVLRKPFRQEDLAERLQAVLA